MEETFSLYIEYIPKAKYMPQGLSIPHSEGYNLWYCPDDSKEWLLIGWVEMKDIHNTIAHYMEYGDTCTIYIRMSHMDKYTQIHPLVVNDFE